MRGLVAGLLPASARLAALVCEVRTRDYVVDQFMTRCVLKEETRTMVSGIASRLSMVIKYQDESQVGGAYAGHSPKQTYLHTNLMMSKAGCAIKLYVGDIIRHPADVIIIAANHSLNHVSGLARALVKEGWLNFIHKYIQACAGFYVYNQKVIILFSNCIALVEPHDLPT